MASRREESSSRGSWYLPWLIVAAGLWAYRTSFDGAFLFDDYAWILGSGHPRSLWPLTPILTGTLRPLVEWSLAANYVVGQFHVFGYHVVNVAIHLLAGAVLFGLVRRTLLTERLRAAFGSAAPWLALAVALLWVVHPLQTQSVTYLSQRAESLMGLWYLLTLYGVLRGSSLRHRRWWHAVAVAACALGMASKPVMITAPLMALCYDGIFLSGSWREAIRRHRGLYAGLAATWVVLAWELASVPMAPEVKAGFHADLPLPIEYACTQPGVMLHYLALSFWPHPLVLDYYDWPSARAMAAWLPQSLAILALLLATGWALRHRPAIGFLGVWFFLILAPTSSIFPLGDFAFEYRMYLPLAGVIGFLVLGSWHLLSHLTAPAAFRQAAAAGFVLLWGAALGLATARRNLDYRSQVVMWRDVISKRPANARAHNNLANVLAQQGNLQAAAAHYEAAIQFNPNQAHIRDYAEVRARAHNNLGNVRFLQGKPQEAIAHYQAALQLQPDYEEARRNLDHTLNP